MRGTFLALRYSHIILVLFVCTYFFVPSIAQVPFPIQIEKKKEESTTSHPTPVRYDSSKVLQRQPSDDRMKEFSGSAFEYDRAMAPETLSWWEKLMQWLRNKLTFYSGTNADTIVWDLLTWVFIITAVVLLVYLLARNNGGGFLTSSKKHIVLSHEELPEDIHELNFEDKIRESLQAGNYRRAVRFQFLRVLKHLSDSGLVELTASKTNRVYIRELRSTQYQSTFSELVLIFDFIWYGEFAIDKEEYISIEPKFTAFVQSLPRKQIVQQSAQQSIEVAS